MQLCILVIGLREIAGVAVYVRSILWKKNLTTLPPDIYLQGLCYNLGCLGEESSATESISFASLKTCFRLVLGEDVKFNTSHRHADSHNQWLRQEE